MKKLMRITVDIKSFAGMCFMGMTIVYMLIAALLGERAISFSVILQFLGLALLCAFAQYAFFHERLRLPGGARLALLAAALYVCFGACALLFRWFPFTAVNWLLFTLAYCVVIAILALALFLYRRITGEHFNHLLRAYQAREE